MKKDNDPTHSQTHSKRYFCKVAGCPKQHIGYTRKKNLDDHVRSRHTSQRFPCCQCSTTFTRCGDLLTHVKRLHHRDKPFVCSPKSDNSHGCGATFASKFSLNRHRRSFEQCNGPEVIKHMEGRPARELERDSDLRERFMATAAAQVAEQLALYPQLAKNMPNQAQITIFGEASFQDTSTPLTDPIRGDFFNSLYVKLINVFRRRRSGTCGQLLVSMQPVLRNLLSQRFSIELESEDTFQKSQLHSIQLFTTASMAVRDGSCSSDFRNMSAPSCKDTQVSSSQRSGAATPKAPAAIRPIQVASDIPSIDTEWYRVLHAPVSSHPWYEQNTEKEAVRKTTINVVDKALAASQYCKSIVSGHTDSVVESVIASRHKSSLAGSDAPVETYCRFPEASRLTEASEDMIANHADGADHLPDWSRPSLPSDEDLAQIGSRYTNPQQVKWPNEIQLDPSGCSRPDPISQQSQQRRLDDREDDNARTSNIQEAIERHGRHESLLLWTEVLELGYSAEWMKE